MKPESVPFDQVVNWIIEKLHWPTRNRTQPLYGSPVFAGRGALRVKRLLALSNCFVTDLAGDPGNDLTQKPRRAASLTANVVLN